MVVMMMMMIDTVSTTSRCFEPPATLLSTAFSAFESRTHSLLLLNVVTGCNLCGGVAVGSCVDI
jgi:hypothetical protein